MRTPVRIKALLNLAAAAILLGVTAVSFRAEGFSGNFGLAFVVSLVLVPTLLLLFFRRAGTVPGCIGIVLLGLLTGFYMRDAAAAVLVCTLCLGMPLVLTLYWPRCRGVKPLARATLPAAGALYFAGTLLFCYLRFGEWSFAPITDRLQQRLLALFDRMEALYVQLYTGNLLNQLQQYLQIFRKEAAAISFNILAMALYGLFGLYFFAVLIADRRASRDGLGRWSGGWAALIPGSGISLIYMVGYLITSMLGDRYYQVLSAVFQLFGFFYVFTAVYRLRAYLRKRALPSLLTAGICGLLLVLSYLTVGGSLLSAYTILLLVGWWFAASPARRRRT